MIEKNIEKKSKSESQKKIKDTSILLAFLVIPTHLKSLIPLCKSLKSVIFDFFLLQFSVKFKLRKIPIVNVNELLDNRIPFRPDKTDTYLDFIHFWIRPLSFIIERFGVKKAVPHCARFMDCIYTAYSQAAKIYKYKMSTTPRPHHGGNKNLKTIHRLDPHYLCVPSLHIAVVTLTYIFFDDVFKKENIPETERKVLTSELYSGAIEIAETVLYVKQHSVNCIPAALYMMIYLLNEKGITTFNIEEAVKFINDLFITAKDVTPLDRIQINTHIQYMFDRLILEGCNENDWTIPIKRWLSMQETESNSK